MRRMARVVISVFILLIVLAFTVRAEQKDQKEEWIEYIGSICEEKQISPE